MKTVLVVGREWKFRALLRAELREQGYEARGFETLEEATAEVARRLPSPAALVFDTTDATAAEMARDLPGLAQRLPVLVVGAGHEAFDFPQDKQLGSARLTVLRRPLRLEEVVAAVRKVSELTP